MSILIIVCLFALTACATTRENVVNASFKDHKLEFNTILKNGVARDYKIESDGKLESYIAYAMKNSPKLEAQFERWQAGIHKIARMRRLPDPVISYAYYINHVETRVGPQRHKVSFRQSFPWPTRLIEGANAASAKAKAEGKRFDALAISIAAAVEEKYWILWKLKRIKKVHEDHLSILMSLSKTAGAQLMTGKIALADHQQIDLTAARVEDLILSLDESIIKAGTNLKKVMGAPQSMHVKIESEPDFSQNIINKESLEASVRSHPYIYSFEALAQASKAEAKKEKASRYPGFSLGVDWIETGETSIQGVPDSGKDAIIVGGGISVPLWQHNYKESEEARYSEMRSYRAEGKAAEDKAIAQFYIVLSDIRNATRKIKLYERTLIPKAQSIFESVLGSYISGRGTVTTILLAQSDLLDLKIQLIIAQADYSSSWAALENVVGHEIVTPDSGNQ